MYASTKRLHNTPQHIHYDVNLPENFNCTRAKPSKSSGKVKTLLTIGPVLT